MAPQSTKQQYEYNKTIPLGVWLRHLVLLPSHEQSGTDQLTARISHGISYSEQDFFMATTF